MNVTFTRGVSESNEYKDFPKYLENCNKDNVCKNLLKIEICKLIQPILKETGLSNLQITNSLINDIDLNIFKDYSSKSNIVLTKLVFGALYRISIEASDITNKDYASYLNDIYDEVSKICDNIIYLLNSK